MIRQVLRASRRNMVVGLMIRGVTNTRTERPRVIENSSATALPGVESIPILAVSQRDGDVEYTIETTAIPVGSGSAGRGLGGDARWVKPDLAQIGAQCLAWHVGAGGSAGISHVSHWPLLGRCMTICPPRSDNFSLDRPRRKTRLLCAPSGLAHTARLSLLGGQNVIYPGSGDACGGCDHRDVVGVVC